ncbi:bifunctional adenosylcobinamide kinase/adenosylcobinamide-phosphate guanylyltransferase [Lachnoanaerobaculum gingivalis]|mgnify:FL=1|uniref:bifunctional adenosylcobinamide kinase/adenosylcobinamide-phosphate guanylyltransferase n=1 Tax=Lachnoanaerobaculum gingivalis TaxID=2490855 RepID=UPI0028D51D33|nr:bifunctional adenosylcobinamide kinase/adenosylcobinamide-phosphate guanylyltransferase [Lachnoanaerobaculum gingivalis]
MITYIYGGVSSGKSEYAEELISREFNKKIYLATMENTGEYAGKRVEKHLLQREGKGFFTIEEPRHIKDLNIDEDYNILLEDLTNLLSNNLFNEAGLKNNFKEITEEIFSDIITLKDRCNSVFIVGNDIFSTERNQSKELDIFIDCLYSLHNKIIEVADRVIEVVYGLPYDKKLI